jgi:hypothetical protein
MKAEILEILTFFENLIILKYLEIFEICNPQLLVKNSFL